MSPIFKIYTFLIWFPVQHNLVIQWIKFLIKKSVLISASVKLYLAIIKMVTNVDVHSGIKH